MKITQRVKKILDNYESDNPGTKANLARILMQGRLGGSGKLVRTLDELRTAAKDWVANPRPMVIDVRISRTVMSIPYRRLHYGKDE